MNKEYDLGELVGGTVDSIKEKFGDLSDGQLSQLRELEQQGGARTTLLSAIEQEQAERAEAAKADDAGAAAASAAGLFTQAQVNDQLHAANESWQIEHDAALKRQQDEFDAKVVELVKAQQDAFDGKMAGMFTLEQLDQALAQQKLANDEAIKLAVAEVKGAKPPKPKATKVAEPLTIDAKSTTSPALVALTGASRIVFVDDEDRPIDTLTPMLFEAHDFDPNGNGVKLKRDIDFPMELAEREVSGAFVMGEDGKPVGKARLVMPVAISGGRQARLQAGTLSFARD